MFIHYEILSWTELNNIWLKWYVEFACAYVCFGLMAQSATYWEDQQGGQLAYTVPSQCCCVALWVRSLCLFGRLSFQIIMVSYKYMELNKKKNLLFNFSVSVFGCSPTGTMSVPSVHQNDQTTRIRWRNWRRRQYLNFLHFNLYSDNLTVLWNWNEWKLTCFQHLVGIVLYGWWGHEKRMTPVWDSGIYNSSSFHENNVYW